MLFSSIFFLFLFLPAFLTVYFLLPDRWKNLFTLAASVLFYAWGAPKFVFILSAAVVLDFFLALQIAKADGKLRKNLLILAIGINLSILLYFKYVNFFVENFCLAFGCNPQGFAQVLLPIGISFFTFHEISYLTDVYRKVKEPFKNVINYALYIFLFPQLIAGPIIRFHEIADQIENRKFNDNINNRLLGFFRFSIGLGKKVLIADVLGAQVTKIFALQSPDFGVAWLGAVMNLLNIYIDFSAYSDMAIGLALMMGFRFPENFNSPLISQSVTEYWQRWHTSLTRWLREYLFIPLGGSRGSEWQTCRNIFIVFFLSGLWHGASWNFVVWGSACGLMVIAERVILRRYLENAPKVFRILIAQTFMIVVVVFFTFHEMKPALNYLQCMFTGGSESAVFLTLKTKIAFVFSIVIAFGALVPQLESFSTKLYQPFDRGYHYVLASVFSVLLILLSASMLFISGYQPFLYFKF